MRKARKILIISIIVYNINIVDTGYTHSTVCIVFIVRLFFSFFSFAWFTLTIILSVVPTDAICYALASARQ